MADGKFHELIAVALKLEAGFSATRATVLAAHFGSLEEFLTVDPAQLQPKSVTGKRITTLTPDQIKALSILQRSGVLTTERSLQENFVVLISRDFVRTQTKMIERLSLDRMSPNPFLIKCLNLRTPREVVELNVYMFATRSIVTSMGFFVEKLLLASSDRVSLCDKPWDILKVDAEGKRHWIQVKSGPNDMDVDQIRHWSGVIAAKIGEGDDAYIGVTYGKRVTTSVTLGIFKTYLKDWEKRTLIGRELWDFISEDPTYHKKLFPLLAEAAAKILGADSIESRIQRCIDRITDEFTRRYPSPGEVEKYLADIF